VIPPPSEDLGTEEREQARRRLGITGLLVVFAGVRRDYKGADVLYAAAPSIGANVEHVTIAFVGPGEPMRPIRGVSIVDAGEVDQPTMGDWIRAADVLALPSLYEACSIVVLEAWSAGVPVVVSDIPTLACQVEASGGGVAVPRDPEQVADAIIGLLEDPERRRALGVSGRAYWEAHCPIGGIVTAHEELYARLAES
jgi:glycosyltransferase involved in cell wall biosynthesis